MYIDPGTGSMLLQVLIASALGSFIAFRRFIFRFFSWLKSRLQSPKDGNA